MSLDAAIHNMRVAAAALQLELLRIEVEKLTAARKQEERRMAVPQARGFVTQARALRDAMQKKLAAQQDQLTAAYGELDSQVSAIDDEIKEVKALAMELQADAAVTGNGGPPLESSPPLSPPAPENSGDQRAQSFSDLHPSARRPPGT